ncbi:putative serine protease F56F10.1 [Toxorhynchites rutilus septentrionalis]|uniref:putative serine protease F56F10.1 n=1 Tax=Toxorhynchites rutilus septentrionalis TaxID=329112 RepID=UPI00247A5CEF|nr:putative serine protease F56F10.1 [Toxorhynchites rutilus septentrionalis]
MYVKFANLLLCYLCFFEPVSCARSFWRGKKFTQDGPSRVLTSWQSKNVETLWFGQWLDHNDATNPTTWKQRYYVNDEFFKRKNNKAPVFLMIGGEEEATARWMKEGAWIHYAREHGALCFQLEHRFYGKSRPTADLSTENLAYLTSEQALADLAFFIEAMNEKYQLTSQNRWIAFGGSYPGSLAAWLREKYPHLVYGAISSSGPLLAKIDFTEYFDVVVDSLGSYSKQCVENVHTAMSQMEILLKHMIGQRSLTDKFRLCDPVEKSISNPLDISGLFEAVASNFAGIVQYNKDNSPHAKITIDQVCDVMVNQSIGVPVSRLAVVNEMVMKQDEVKCLDYVYDKTIKQMKNTSWESDVATGARQWTYQTCNEFGFYQTSDDSSKVFGDRFPVEFFLRQCTDIYGKKFNAKSLDRAIYRTNTNYGALDPSTRNVLYVHGSIDPWHRLGLIESNDINTPTIFINGTAHCANMYEPVDDDFPQLKAARVKIDDYIANLLKFE